MKNIMIGTPSYDGKTCVQYTYSLLGTVALGATKNLNISPLFIAYDSLIQRARNDLIRYAYESNVDYLIMVDSDQSWFPQSMIDMIEYEVDVAGMPVRKKSQESIEYNVKYTKNFLDKNDFHKKHKNLLHVESIGTGIMLFSRNAIKFLFENSEIYHENNKHNNRMVFEVKVKDGFLYSEDVMVCDKLNNNGFPVYAMINARPTHHEINSAYTSDFETFLKKVFENKKEISNNGKSNNKR